MNVKQFNANRKLENLGYNFKRYTLGAIAGIAVTLATQGFFSKALASEKSAENELASRQNTVQKLDISGKEFARQGTSQVTSKSASLQEMLGKKEYSGDLRIHDMIERGALSDTLKNTGGLMPNTSTYVMNINGTLVPHTINKDSLQAAFGFRNFPKDWRARQCDRETKDIRGAKISLLIGGSTKYTEAVVYGHEGMIVLFTPHNAPSMKNSEFIFYPFENPKRMWEYGTLVENGPVSQRFVSKTKDGSPNPYYDPYAVVQGDAGISMLTTRGDQAYGHVLPLGYVVKFVFPITGKATSKTLLTMDGKTVTVSEESESKLSTTVDMIFDSRSLKLTDSLGIMGAADKLAPVIVGESVLERVLGIEQSNGKVVITDPISDDIMRDIFHTDKFGGREEVRVDLGVGNYVVLNGGSGKAWVTATTSGVSVVYAGDRADEIKALSLEGDNLIVSNPDAPLNKQVPVFRANEDGKIISWQKSGVWVVTYPSDGFFLSTDVKGEMKNLKISIESELNRVTLSRDGTLVKQVDVNYALYTYVGEKLKYGPKY